MAPLRARHEMGVGRATVLALAVLVAAAIAGALLALSGARVIDAATPRDALDGDPRTALGLFAHNVPVALWPLGLIALGWPAIMAARTVGDVLVAGQLLGHGALLGSALAQHPELWHYLPHLPLEWLAIALPGATWLTGRFGTRASAPRLMATVAITVALLGLAALLETYTVPLP